MVHSFEARIAAGCRMFFMGLHVFCMLFGLENTRKPPKTSRNSTFSRQRPSKTHRLELFLRAPTSVTPATNWPTHMMRKPRAEDMKAWMAFES